MYFDKYPEQLKTIDYYARSLYSTMHYTARVHVDFQDLVQAGRIGLWKAIEKYDRSKDPKQFSVYARLRIVGGMIDTVRRFCPIEFRVNRKKKPPISFTSFDIDDSRHINLTEINTDVIDNARLISKIKNSINGKRKRILNKYLKDIDQVDIARDENLSSASISLYIKKIIKKAQLDYAHEIR